MERSPTLLLLTGPPGTGKSSLADLAADALYAPVLGWDWAMAALTEFDGVQDALREMSHLDHRRVGWSVLWNLATAQLRRGSSVVLDGVAREVEVSGTRRVGRSSGASVVVVLTSCSDVTIHRERLVGRAREIPGWHELDWDHVSRLLDRWEPPDDVDLHLDAANPLTENAAQLRALLAPLA